MLMSITTNVERWPLREAFVISRGTKTEAEVVTITIAMDGAVGRGECVPYGRYGETTRTVLETIHAWRPDACRNTLLSTVAAGAARNAIDCALWDLEAKLGQTTAYGSAGLAELKPLETCFTLSLATPAAMGAKALSVPKLKLLKLKLGGAGDDERMAAVRQARPDARLVADANEAWTTDMLEPFMLAAARCQFELIEQPLPVGADEALKAVAHTVPICADESVHTSRDILSLADRYDAINIKLDKAGGLTEALRMVEAAKSAGLRIMCGSMVATSLSMAPAVIVAQSADWVDLDGPLLLARDRDHGLVIADGWVTPPARELWG